ncbi:MAG: FG-GAP and VCBS repeat-containing protein [Verrucomicrobiota bacterium]
MSKFSAFPNRSCRSARAESDPSDRPTNHQSAIGNQKFVAIPLVIGLLCASANAKDLDQPPRDFGFQPLEIFKFDNGASRLIVDDINGDGLDDILFANNHISRLEILVRKADTEETDDLPELDERFDNKGMIVDQALKALRVADLDNNGRLDIITFGTAIGLQLRYQQEDGTFGDPERIFIKDPSSVTTIQIGDLNENGKKDILVCRRDQADLHWNTETRPFQEKKTLTFSADKSYYGDIADINADGIADLAFHFNTPRNPLKVRYGKGDGLYGTEQPIDLPPRQYMDILQPEGSEPQIGMVLRNRLAFRTYGFAEKEQPPLLGSQEISPARIGLEGTGKKNAPAWVASDFNGDGYDDLLVAAPELSRLHLYSGSGGGLDPEPRRIDTLSEATRISRLANGDILVVSKKEKIAALHSAAALDRFPAILKTPGNVLAGCAIESGDDCWFVCKNDDKKLQLVRTPAKGGKADVFGLDMQNDPSDLLAFRLPESRVGLIFFMAYDTPKMHLFDGSQLEELTSESFRALTQQLTLPNIRLGAPGDGSVLTVSQGAIARRFEWRGDRYEATRQFNPENPRGELIASCGYELLDGSSGTLLYDRNSGDLVRFDAEGDGWGKVHIPDADQTIFALAQLKNKDRDTVVLLGRTGLNEIISNGTRLAPVSEAEYISPSEDPMLAYAKAVKLGSPPRPMVALIDPANRAIELVGMIDGELRKELLFEVYLTSDFVNRKQNRGTEPHDVESGDLNGDGIGDLVVLSQDKLLIYLGE